MISCCLTVEDSISKAAETITVVVVRECTDTDNQREPNEKMTCVRVHDRKLFKEASRIQSYAVYGKDCSNTRTILNHILSQISALVLFRLYLHRKCTRSFAERLEINLALNLERVILMIALSMGVVSIYIAPSM